MSVKRIISPLWKSAFPDLESRLRTVFERGLEKGSGRAEVWFRADDIGVPSAGFSRMTGVFREFDMSLALAAVPVWLTERRWEEVRRQAGEGRWCFHQHGRSHMNHEVEGRKCEFGPGRTRAEKALDLMLGRERLERIMGRDFQPFFTPGWNRFDVETGEILRGIGFQGVSRDDKAFLRQPAPLPEVMINCDLHTRSRPAAEDREVLLSEIEYWTEQGLVGFMLHHQRMNDRALEFLRTVFMVIHSMDALKIMTMPELVADARTV